MDGSGVEILLDKSKQVHDVDVGWPNDIVIDRSSSDEKFSGEWSQKPNIYWCDAKYDHIARADEDFRAGSKVTFSLRNNCKNMGHTVHTVI